MMKKREEPVELHSACISALSPSRRLPRRVNPRFTSPPVTYSLYSNQTDDTVWVNPDSPEWFRWLDGLTCFEFDGQDGDFIAFKQTSNKPGEAAHWIACQQLADKEYTRDLGPTANLTTFFLEEVAADLETSASSKEREGTGEGDLIYPFLAPWKGPDKRGWKSIRYRCLLTYQ